MSNELIPEQANVLAPVQAQEMFPIQTGMVDYSGIPQDYNEIVQLLVKRIQVGRYRAFLAVNQELVDIYWFIGMVIKKKKEQEGVNSQIIRKLSKDMTRIFPTSKMFTRSNLFRIATVYDSWSNIKLDEQILEQISKEFSLTVMSRNHIKPFDSSPKEPLTEQDMIYQIFRSLPWGHSIELAQRVKEPNIKVWYALMAIKNGWSRSILSKKIDTNLHLRQGRAVSNFTQTLSSENASLAVFSTQDPYVFDFIHEREDALERDIENELLSNLKRLLLELGDGFAFVAQQYKVTVGDSDYILDLLFYNIILKCYVVVELKAVGFKSEFVSKLNVYLAAIDDTLKKDGDNPTIGLLLCKNKDSFNAEYTLKTVHKPIAVADYVVNKIIPKELTKSLPSIADLQFIFSTL